MAADRDGEETAPIEETGSSRDTPRQLQARSLKPSFGPHCLGLQEGAVAKKYHTAFGRKVCQFSNRFSQIIPNTLRVLMTAHWRDVARMGPREWRKDVYASA